MLDFKPLDPIYTRLRDIGSKMVPALEREYLIVAEDYSTLNDRIRHLKQHILEQIEVRLGIPSDPDAEPIKRVRVVKNLIDEEMYDEVPDATAYTRRIHVQMMADVVVEQGYAPRSWQIFMTLTPTAYKVRLIALLWVHGNPDLGSVICRFF